MKKLLGIFITTLMSGMMAMAALGPGDVAPPFELKGSDGKTYKLSDFKGKQPVVVAWFPKAFTGGCTAECKSLKENGEKLKKLDVAYFTASIDDPETNKKFAESLHLDYPILSDPGKDVAKAYGVINEERKVPFRWTFYIDKDGRIAYVDKEVKTDQHGSHMVEKLRELGVKERAKKD